MHSASITTTPTTTTTATRHKVQGLLSLLQEGNELADELHQQHNRIISQQHAQGRGGEEGPLTAKRATCALSVTTSTSLRDAIRAARVAAVPQPFFSTIPVASISSSAQTQLDTHAAAVPAEGTLFVGKTDAGGYLFTNPPSPIRKTTSLNNSEIW